MIFTNREEKLVDAFLELGSLSLKEMSDILQVSSRTVYRTLSDLMLTLKTENIHVVKKGKQYYLEGDLTPLKNANDSTTIISNRLLGITYDLLNSSKPLINEELQRKYQVSNVTIIRSISQIEERLKDFKLDIVRNRGYLIEGTIWEKRKVLAILLTNAISTQDFNNDQYNLFECLNKDILNHCKISFDKEKSNLGDLDPKIRQYLIILLALADNTLPTNLVGSVSRKALGISQSIFTNLSKLVSSKLYGLQEVLFFASILDETDLMRQETPLFQERFDGDFYYSVSQLIDMVSRLTKIEFFRDKQLFHFLFQHLKLSLAVPILFPEFSRNHVAYLATQNNTYLHNVVSLVVKDIFPNYIQNDYEYSLLTLHFASSLRRSPDIYPISMLLVTDERPLVRSVLVSKIKSAAPFVGDIRVISTSQLKDHDTEDYDYCLSTKHISQYQMDIISIFPSTKEIIELQERLQDVQLNRTIRQRKRDVEIKKYDIQTYLSASTHLLRNFKLISYSNPKEFTEMVNTLVNYLDNVSEKSYLAAKLVSRFDESPMAIPKTNLLLLHTQSHAIVESQFLVVQLDKPVLSKSMNHELEEVHRVLVMLTKINESDEVRDLMTAISQSIIENNLYTEIYKTGNREILYQLLNTIFNERIKKLEEKNEI